jgi:hypothetical protein
MVEVEFNLPEPKRPNEKPAPTETPPATAEPTAPPALEIELGVKPVPPPQQDAVNVYHEIDPDPAMLLRNLLAQGGDDGTSFAAANIALHNSLVAAQQIERRARKAIAKKRREEQRGGR